MSRELIVSITYIVVVLSILVQAMSIAKLVKKNRRQRLIYLNAEIHTARSP